MKPHIARKLLKVNVNATNSEIKRAWKREMRVHHPDKHKNNDAKVKYCKSLNEAKYTLLDTFEEISTTQRKNIYYPFDSPEEEFLFWEWVIRGNDEW